MLNTVLQIHKNYRTDSSAIANLQNFLQVFVAFILMAAFVTFPYHFTKATVYIND
eukprot:m.130719 g.130719  ORF g.130719 m.130719 type:complete len:55 (+) comp38037_c0_seq5:669-833(+)